jgi:hypothetical protein
MINSAITCAALSFETEKIKSVYDLLPEKIQQMIETENKKTFQLKGDLIVPNSLIHVRFNNSNQIAHIGLYLSGESQKKSGLTDVHYFVETCLLNFILLPSSLEIQRYIKKNEISFLLNNKSIPFEVKEITSFIAVLLTQKFSIDFQNYFFIANWETESGENFAMKIPADINLIKGMDKSELELDLIRKMKDKPIDVYEPKIDNKQLKRLASGLYIQTGQNFSTDDFRSDIYLTKKTASNYEPVFASQYPVESFSNLFICNLKIQSRVEVIGMLYGEKKRMEDLTLDELQSFLAENNEVYFGLLSHEEKILKATVIYFNPMYRYIHMLVTETDEQSLFNDNENNTIQATLYLFIPRTDINNTIFIK